MRERDVGHVGHRRVVVVRPIRNDLTRFLEQLLSLVTEPERRSLGSHIKRCAYGGRKGVGLESRTALDR